MIKLNSKVRRIASYLALAIAFYFLLTNIFQNWQEIKNHILGFNIFQLIIIFLIIGFLHVLNTSSWHFLTRTMNYKISFRQNFYLWMLPNISRYIPGVIWQYAGRIYLLSKEGKNKSQALITVALDALFTFCVGVFVVFITIFLFNFSFIKGVELILFIIILLFSVMVLALGNKKFLGFILKTAYKLTKREYLSKVPNLQSKWLVFVCLINFLQFIIAGVSIFLIAKSLYPVSENLLLVSAGIYAGSWILGYISFFAPGGLGIQELSIAGLLSLFMPLPLASLTAVLFRFLLIISEFFVVGILILASPTLRKAQ